MKQASNIRPPEGPALESFLRKTPTSRHINERARSCLPGGNTRSHAFFRPYPLVFERGVGPHLWDVDGHRYVDYTYNGLSVIHGYAFEPIERAIRDCLPGGTAWVGTSRPQVEYATYLCHRIAAADLVRFTNTGTEAMMLATKLARRCTNRPLVLKSWGAYHGSYDDLEAGLYGIGDLPGRTALATFGDLESYRRAFVAHPGQIAAVIVEPVLFTFHVVPPPSGFLAALTDLAHEHGALVVLDDCLMFRLAPGGSAEKYGFVPDLTCLGKFIGGSLPMGVVAGSHEVMQELNPLLENSMYHGGSFNGNPLAAAAGMIGLQELTRERIVEMGGRADRLRTTLRALGESAGVNLDVTGDGSVLGVYVSKSNGDVDSEACAYLHLAALDRGVFYGPDGDMALCTTLDDRALDATLEAFEGALAETAKWAASRL